MSKRHTNFLLVALLSFLSLLIMFSCKLSSSKIEPANTETGDNTDTGTGGSEDTQTEDQGLPEVLSGEFSVSADKKVQFTRGNLYYDGSNTEKPWGIEAKQYDYRTWKDCASIINGASATTQENNVGLFFWSKAADVTYNYQYSDPNRDSSDEFVFAKTTSHECIIPGYDILTKDEWSYLRNERENANSLFGYATITTSGGVEVKGYVLLPSLPAPVNFASGTTSNNKYNNEEWTLMEGAGAVFLPFSGGRNGTQYTPASGRYWSSTPETSNSGRANMFFTDNGGYVYISERNVGASVRLVKRVE